MYTLALPGLETAINSYCRLDPDTITRLAALSDKVIKVEIIDWRISFYIAPDSHGIQLLAEYSQEPDTTIKGTLFGLFRVSLAGASGSSLFDNTIEISGDTDTGEAIRDILRKIDIDWEEHLSHLVGDTLAHQAARRFNQAVKFGKRSVEKLQENIKEYIHEEARYFPTQQQANQLYKNIGKLRDDVDRAEARIKRLTGG